MDTNQILGYIASFLIGITLGLFGGGGTILTVPVLYYLLHIESDISILYSMFIVGMATFVGGINSYIKHNLNLKSAYSFGIPSLFAVFITRKTITPWIDAQTWMMGSYVLTGKHFLMFLFAVLMIIVSLFMIIKKQDSVIDEQVKKKKFYFGIILKAMLVGFISGLIGAGGGFIIVPSLMTFYKLNVKEAIGTSLIIIAANSFFGFMGDFIQLSAAPFQLSFDSNRFYTNEWSFLLLFSFIAILGILSGLWIARRVQANRLKVAFGYFVLLMGIYVFFKELFIK